VSDQLPSAPHGEFLLYQGTDGESRIDVRMVGETLWLTQGQMAELFQTTPQNITIHLKRVYDEGELVEEATCKRYLQVQTEGGRQVERSLKHYDLDAIISVGYRVNSLRGTQFRIWATQRLREYLVKGFTMNDQRLKDPDGGAYFDELLARIRDIRSSEKVFWRKVLDIYATSIDYNSKAEVSGEFFKVVQNKMHWASHGQTAAEVIHDRADAGNPTMGLTNWQGGRVRKKDVAVAKNYLRAEELDVLNRMVTAYLELAELQAMNRQPMYMRDWIERLDDFLKMTGRELLDHAGTVSHQAALDKAHVEYDAYQQRRLAEPTEVEKHFIEAEGEVKRLEQGRPKEGGGQ